MHHINCEEANKLSDNRALNLQIMMGHRNRFYVALYQIARIFLFGFFLLLLISYACFSIVETL